LVGPDDLGPQYLLGFSKIYLFLRVDVLTSFLLGGHFNKARHALVSDINLIIHSWTERILFAALFRVIGLEIEPHDPEKCTSAALTSVFCLHYKVVELSIRREMQLGDLAC